MITTREESGGGVYENSLYDLCNFLCTSRVNQKRKFIYKKNNIYLIGCMESKKLLCEKTHSKHSLIITIFLIAIVMVVILLSKVIGLVHVE